MKRLLLPTILLSIAACAPSQAAAATCVDPVDGAPPVLGSTDGDSFADLAVGRPAQAKVVVRQTRAGKLTLTGGSSFGRAVAVGDLDGDACADLAVGEPAASRVLVYRGSPTGLQTGTPVTVAGTAGSGFGTALAIAQDTGLWVGAPAAGEVRRYTLDAGATVTPQGVFTAAAPTDGERFGSVLAPGVNGAYVGVPKRSKDRGAVEQLRVGQPSVVFTLPHAARGDRFGAAVSTSPSGGTAIAGAPGRFRGRGAVQVLGGKRYTQDTKGVPGKARRGNRFGAAVAAGRALTCQEDGGSFAVGAPGDDSVTLVSPGEQDCPKRLTYASRAGVGTALGIVRGRDDFDEDIEDTLVIGQPGRDRVVLAPQPKLAVPGSGRIVIGVPQSGSALL